MHVPVLLERVTELLAPACAADGAVLVDATLGLAGHTLAMLDAHPGLRLIGLDRDPDARAEAARRIEAAGHTDRVTLVPAVFDELPDVLDRLGIDEVQGVLFDLGVSSLQLDRPDRGFSYSADAPLDMRMDPARPAHRRRRRQHLLRRRSWPACCGSTARSASPPASPPRSTASARGSPSPRPPGWPSWSATSIPAATRRTGGHPAKRTFQALRIEVNDELGALSGPCPRRCRGPGRRRARRRHHLPLPRGPHRQADPRRGRRRPDAARACRCPLPELGPVLRLLTRGGEAASEAELARQPRAASARVRAAERIRRAA